jgi:hypothetical protein
MIVTIVVSCLAVAMVVSMWFDAFFPFWVKEIPSNYEILFKDGMYKWMIVDTHSICEGEYSNIYLARKGCWNNYYMNQQIHRALCDKKGEGWKTIEKGKV